MKLKVLFATLALNVAAESPDGPSQQCADDAGPPWGDDEPGARYYANTPAEPLGCPEPLAAACATKGVKAALLDGPLDCKGKGWFCRIMRQDGWRNPDFVDYNFAHCNVSDADERDDGGHCHGSDDDSTYGWWIRDHWFRGYAGALTCSCDWGGTKGLVNRCDYRRYVSQKELPKCRDANEDNEGPYPKTSYEGGCADYPDFSDPCEAADSQCWTVMSFADPESVSGGGGGGNYPDDPPPDGGDGDYPEPPEDEPDEPPEEDEPDEPDEEDDGCRDDDEWATRRKGKMKGCGWVSKKVKKRCKDKYESEDGVSAIEGCPETCGECGDEEEEEEEEDECRDDEDYRYDGKDSKDCVWVEDKPHKRCKKEGAEAACCACSEM